MLGGRFEVFLPPAGQKSVNTSHVILCATLLKKFLGLSAGVDHYKTEKQYLNYRFFSENIYDTINLCSKMSGNEHTIKPERICRDDVDILT